MSECLISGILHDLCTFRCQHENVHCKAMAESRGMSYFTKKLLKTYLNFQTKIYPTMTTVGID